MAKLTIFNKFDNDDAFKVYSEAKEAGLDVSNANNDFFILSCVTRSFTTNEPSNITRKEFEESLARIKNAIKLKSVQNQE